MKKVLLISLILFSFTLIGCDKKDNQKDKPKEDEQIEEQEDDQEEEEIEENPNAKVNIKDLIGTWEAVKYSRAGKVYEKEDFDKFEATLVIKSSKNAKLNMTTINGEKRELSLYLDLEDVRYLFEYGDNILDYIFSLKDDILYIYEEDINPDSIVMDVDCIMFKKVK